MKESPIVFSKPMVRAILEGRKTQTRRLVKETDILGVRKLLPGELQSVGAISDDNAAGELRAYLSKYPGVSLGVVKCPYGVPGDRLWVREAFALEITEVRVQRLQDISTEDAIAEGVPCSPVFDEDRGIDGQAFPRREFFDLWDSIYGEGASKENPWVWAITFKRLEVSE